MDKVHFYQTSFKAHAIPDGVIKEAYSLQSHLSGNRLNDKRTRAGKFIAAYGRDLEGQDLRANGEYRFECPIDCPIVLTTGCRECILGRDS